MTLYRSLLSRGYFPKELPPAFSTLAFSEYAISPNGRKTISDYQPLDNFTECSTYRLARHGMRQRELRVPHPASFSKLAKLIAANFKRLIKLSKASRFTGSEPVPGKDRALEPLLKPWDLPVSRANTRAGCTFLLKADISEFYPSLYTHAVGWAVDPKLRLRKNWRKATMLGKKIDQALMDWDGKLSQGLPIGNDLSFLLAEIVLAQVDSGLKPQKGRAFRWFDDYEFAFDNRDSAEVMLKKLTRELGKFRLRLNPKKTLIQQLPAITGEEWQDLIKDAAPSASSAPAAMVKYFDSAFRLRDQHPDAAVLAYALGTLFKIACPKADVGRVADSCISQVVLLEPGAAQKAFALWAYWSFNGFALNRKLITATIERIIDQHQVTGLSNDVAWALAFCLDYGLRLGRAASKTLSHCEDDFISIQALHLRRNNFLTTSFTDAHIIKTLQNTDLDREHWLLAYESVRHNFLTISRKAVKKNPLFAEMLANGITFYRWPIEKKELILHFGGAPPSVASNWDTYMAASGLTKRHFPRDTSETTRGSTQPVADQKIPTGVKRVKDLLFTVSGY